MNISSKAYISKLADIEESTKGSIISIADGVNIDSFVKIKAAGGIGNIFIDSNTYINSGTVMYIGNGIKIGKNVLIAANCTLAPVNHEYRLANKTIIEQRFMPSRGGITIGNDVWIGANTVILDGTNIPDGVVIGASSLVKGNLESYSIYSGNPLQLRGKRT